MALQCQDEYVTGNYSPRMLRVEELEIDAIVYDPVDDMKKLELAREQVRTTGRVRVMSMLFTFTPQFQNLFSQSVKRYMW